MIEDEMFAWHHRLDGHEFKHTLGDGEGQGSLTCCSPRGPKESDMMGRNKERTSYHQPEFWRGQEMGGSSSEVLPTSQEGYVFSSSQVWM